MLGIDQLLCLFEIKKNLKKEKFLLMKGKKLYLFSSVM